MMSMPLAVAVAVVVVGERYLLSGSIALVMQSEMDIIIALNEFTRVVTPASHITIHGRHQRPLSTGMVLEHRARSERLYRAERETTDSATDTIGRMYVL